MQATDALSLEIWVYDKIKRRLGKELAPSWKSRLQVKVDVSQDSR